MERNNHNKKWIKEEDDFLKENYPVKGLKFCAEYLSRSRRATFSRTQKLHLKVNMDIKKELSTKYTKDDILKAVLKAECMSDVMRNLNLLPQSGHFTNIKNRIKEYNIDTSHFLSAIEIRKQRTNGKSGNLFVQRPLNEILIILDKGKKLDNRNLKKRLINEGIFQNCCNNCGISDIWMGKKLSLEPDHINGINNDYRLVNLRLLCPNCHAISDTYCSKNRKSAIRVEKFCIRCNRQFFDGRRDKNYCSNECRYANSHHIKELDTYTEIKLEVKKNGYVATGKKHGVSDNAIRKWLKTFEKHNK
jgi:hypothetical protein